VFWWYVSYANPDPRVAARDAHLGSCFVEAASVELAHLAACRLLRRAPETMMVVHGPVPRPARSQRYRVLSFDDLGAV
jgi:hypothetical protein